MWLKLTNYVTSNYCVIVAEETYQVTRGEDEEVRAAISYDQDAITTSRMATKLLKLAADDRRDVVSTVSSRPPAAGG